MAIARCDPTKWGEVSGTEEMMMADLRVTKGQVLEASGGWLKRQLYVVCSLPTNGIGPVMDNLGAHLEHQRVIERSGILVAAGPQRTDDERFWEGDGMFVISAHTRAEAEEIAASDPMHKAGARSFKVRPGSAMPASRLLTTTTRRACRGENCVVQ
jgi:uncharacterized protein